MEKIELALTIWIVVAIITLILTLTHKKLNLDKNFISRSWDLFKIVTGMLIGSLLEAGLV